jgi:secreted PhoX family phosphatase
VIRRRTALGAAAAVAAGVAASGPPRPAPAQIRRNDLEPMALPVKQDDTVARGYRRDLLLRWGDRVAYDAPRWEPNFPRPEAAAAQFGWDARVAAVAVPQRQAADGVPRAVLAVLHPTVDPLMAWPGGVDRPLVAAAMQGASLLNLEKLDSGWVVVDGGYQTRRLHGGTLCRVSGPFGGGGSVQGLLGPRGGCTTPWGTLLLAEGDPAPRTGASATRAASAGWRNSTPSTPAPCRPSAPRSAATRTATWRRPWPATAARWST